MEELKNAPPQELEAEQMVLGACLLDPGCIGSAEVRPEDFYKSAHGDIFMGMQALHEQGEEVDIITLAPHWKTSKHYEAAGGTSYLSQLAAVCPSAANFRSHERMVISAAQRRALIRRCGEIIQRSYGVDETDVIIADAVRAVNDVRRHSDAAIMPYREMIRMGFGVIEKNSETPGKITGITSGFPGIDRMTNGWQRQWKYVIAGRPGMGKSALAAQLARAAAGAGRKVGVISLEMGPEQIALRDISSASEIPLSRLLAGTLHERDWPRLTLASGKLHDLSIWCAFTAFNDRQVGVMIDDMVQRLGVELIFVDYMQLEEVEDHRGTREQEVSKISRMHKRKTKEHDIPLIELSQLNREVERRISKKPTLADLRESGAIEQDADVVAFIYREDCKCPRNVECACGNRHRAWFSVQKGRMIELGEVELYWHGNTTSFRDISNTEGGVRSVE